MDSKNFWSLFIETGAPEYYMLYNHTRKMEDKDVFENSGLGPQNSGL